VALHDLFDGREVAAHEGSQRFRVELLAERGASGHIGEQDRYRPTALSERHAPAAYPLAAIGAELDGLRVLEAAVGRGVMVERV
jgi:hypothetical protein